MTDPINDNDGPSNDDAPAVNAANDELEGALEAAEATLSRIPEVDYLLVADRAEVVEPRLELEQARSVFGDLLP